MNKLLKAELLEARTRLQDRLASVKYSLGNSPQAAELKCHSEFNEWLEKTKAKDRATPEAIRFINDLNRRWGQAIAASKVYSTDSLIDEQVELEQALQEFRDLFFKDIP